MLSLNARMLTERAPSSPLYTQLSPEENETMIMANAINTLNQVTEATENKVFKQQLQNQLKAIPESLVTHVKYQVENDPLKNPAPLVKRIYDQYQEQQKQKPQQQHLQPQQLQPQQLQPQPQPEDQLKKSEQSEQSEEQPKQPLQEPEISKSNFEKPAAPITLSVEKFLL
ncbi:unnamed protein product [Ambrosiozyma monospora]|uniref:Unnamed protein product n=1 Tax=Ambrosiozyma monospora TaxID=43982 RepID=A0ACB5T3N8_AMBMO|nr:unnamed protein product [Ambrosiozyma monospora]